MFAYESLAMHIWKILSIRAGVDRIGINLGQV